MQSQDLVNATLHRVKRPSTWGAALLFGVAWVGGRALIGLPMGGFALGETLIPLTLLIGTLTLGPVPWLWTGDDRPMAPFLRGLLQAIPWNAAWISITMATLSGLGLAVGPRPGSLLGPPAHQGPPPPPREDPERRDPPPREDPGHPRPPPEGGPGRRPPPPRESWEDGRPPLVEPGDDRRPPRWNRPRGPSGLVVGFINLPLVLLLGWFLADRERTEASEKRLRKLADQARAAALQAQMNPHVLFNALSGLTELVHEDPDAAEEALLELSRMLRLLLHQVGHEQLALREERDLIKSYLMLEKIRLGNRLAVTWVWPEWADGLRYPPLLLMPLVENAIKHGIAPSPEGGHLNIEAHREPGQLRLRVANTGLAETPAGGHGMGHRSLEERLALLDPAARLTLSRQGEWTVAELRLPLPEAT